MKRNRMTAAIVGTAVAGLTATAALVGVPALAAPAGEVLTGQVTDTAAGVVDYSVYLPPGYDEATAEYPTIYLLHGRGDTQAAWQRVSTDLDELINSGQVQPMIAVMPDAPWNDRGNWYTDSLYTGTAASGPGVAVETALAEDLVAHVDETYRTVADREGRAVGGYSMGGAGALRFTLAHQDTFSSAIVLSPAAYTPTPPADSSVRDHGAYGVGDAPFDAARYDELNYPAALAALDPELPVHLFIAVGDDEWANPDPAEAHNDIDMESAQLYNTARRMPGVTAELRILDGGHDWDVWQPAFAEGIVDVASRLRTSPAQPWEAELLGTAGDDRAGGVLQHADGSSTVVVNVADSLDGRATLGGTDVVAIRRDAAGDEVWRTAVGTAANDRSYGVVEGTDGQVLLAGYSRGDWVEGTEAASDDVVIQVVNADGTPGASAQFGDPAAADRAYGVAPDGQGGAFVAGYTSGALPGFTSAGDKDLLVARVAADGSLTWAEQFGGAGEDKVLAAAATPSGGVVVGGVASAALPGLAHGGEGDGWVGSYSADGGQEWLVAVASAENEQVNGLTVLPSGTVIAVGHTKGQLGEEALGDNDIFIRALDGSSGAELWTRQLGTSTDDRGSAAGTTADGDALVLGTTYGDLGGTRGGVDVVSFTVTETGDLSPVTQFGSRERDGADEWDEANLFVAPGTTAGNLVSGLTFGAPAGFTNAGAADVFVQLVSGGVEPEPSASPAPTATVSTSPAPPAPEPTADEPTPSPSATSPTQPVRPGLPSTGGNTVGPWSTTGCSNTGP